MAPQGDIPVAADILGTIGTILWCIQLAPQIWYNWKQKKTDGFPAAMMVLWAVAAVPFGVYAIVQRFTVALQVQPQIFGSLSLVAWGQILYYNNGWKAWSATALTFGTAIAFGGIEMLLVFTLRPVYARGVNAPILVVGILAAVILIIGITPPYPEMWKRKGRVIGINFIFLSIDFAGSIFSLMALVAQQTFDYLGGILYIGVAILEGGIFLSHIIWRIKTKELRRLAKQRGVDIYDLPEAERWYPRVSRKAARAAAQDLENAQATTDTAALPVKASDVGNEPEKGSAVSALRSEPKPQAAMSETTMTSSEDEKHAEVESEQLSEKVAESSSDSPTIRQTADATSHNDAQGEAHRNLDETASQSSAGFRTPPETGRSSALSDIASRETGKPS
ncbi:uncharacterized protein KY384_000505 [Bacidia gigantensis]|uniref:uncharacterized protein n=1 Tax=Bacidia gigantensis TaxID=2732470 RepID=UPI001D055AEF|nr:uncharacterized protein KY384_000505 [Bacidia gigantensis]KAG8525745.1 hypothetical protein KY384_000505 [Bacidia gigantensis]